MIEDKQTCEYCQKEFEWYYIVPQDWNSSKLKAHVIPKGKATVNHVLERNNERIPTKVQV
jgi:hypothetical protein